jgi:hypothetical protein
MTTDEAFAQANKCLDIAIEIWSGKIKSQYDEAERCYQEAIRIRDEYFSDNKKVLTEEPNPF